MGGKPLTHTKEILIIYSNRKDIVIYKPIHRDVKDYQNGIKKLFEGYRLIMESQPLFKGLINHVRVLPERSWHEISEDMVEGVINNMKRDAWHGIACKANVKVFMTSGRYDALLRDLEDPKKLPEITIENIHSFIQNLHISAPDLILEFIKETFDWLRPCRIGGLKTNMRNK